jgi:3'-phosphoadenosine 5'-phosphosulfate (PAPS) 3'-phosphatase
LIALISNAHPVLAATRHPERMLRASRHSAWMVIVSERPEFHQDKPDLPERVAANPEPSTRLRLAAHARSWKTQTAVRVSGISPLHDVKKSTAPASAGGNWCLLHG